MKETAIIVGSSNVAGRVRPAQALQMVARLIVLPLVAYSALGTVATLSVPHRIVAQSVSNQVGTVTSIRAGTLVLKTASGVDRTVTLDPAAKVLQLAPGSKSLHSATPAALSDIAAGDRVLATGTSGTASGTLSATRIILMKSAAIAARNESQQADWRQHGVSGLVRSIDGSAITLSSAMHTIKIDTSPATVVRRYAAGSVDFSAAEPATLADIHVGDQMSVRGTKSPDGSEIAAQEVVAGTFVNLSGVIGSVSAQAQTLTLKDLTIKRNVTVQVTSVSNLRNLTPETARAFQVRNETATPGASGSAPAPDANAQAARTRHAGMDLSRMLASLPAQNLADLKPGEAVMIVASRSGGGGGGPLTVIILLSGVEPLLSAKSSGQNAITLSPWTIGAPDVFF